MSNAQVHRCKFVNWVPSAISTIAVHPSNTLAAVGREDGSVELWHLGTRIAQVGRIAGVPNFTIHSLAWIPAPPEHPLAEPRLISCGLQGSVVEYDLNRMGIKATYDTLGSPAWCAEVSPDGKHVAVGCDDGFLRVFEVLNDRLEYSFTMRGKGERILSLSWSPSGESIVSGCADSHLRVYNLESRAISSHMIGEKKSTIWAVLYLTEETIVSGDSKGNTQFWSVNTSTIEQSLSEHDGDVLCLAASPDRKTVFSSGVDNKIAMFRLISPKAAATAGEQDEDTEPVVGIEQWMYVHNRRPHTHDVASMTLYSDNWNSHKPTLLSGGVDALLCRQEVSNFVADGVGDRVLPYPTAERVLFTQQLSEEGRMVFMVVFDEFVELWKVATPSVDGLSDVADGSLLAVQEQPECIAQLRVSKDGTSIIAAAISPDGRFVAVSTRTGLKLYHITYASTGAIARGGISKVDGGLRSMKLPEIQKMQFLCGSEASVQLVLCCNRQKLTVLDISDVDAVEIVTRERSPVFAADRKEGGNSEADDEMSDGDDSDDEDEDDDESSAQDHKPIRWLIASPHQEMVFVSDSIGRSKLISTSEWEEVCSLPVSGSVITAACFSPDSSTICLATAANEVLLYSTSDGNATAWTKQYARKLPSEFVELRDVIVRISFNHERPNELYLQTHRYFIRVDLAKVVHRNAPITVRSSKSFAHSAWTRQRYGGKEASGTDDEHKVGAFRLIRKLQPMLALHAAPGDALVALERPWVDVLAHLPDTLFRSRFGT